MPGRAFACALAGLLAAFLALPTETRAERGALTQDPDAEGCISEEGVEPCGDGDFLFGAFAVALSADGRHAYVALADGHGVAVLAREPRTGALTQLPSPMGCVSEADTGGLCSTGKSLLVPLSVAVSPDGRHVYVASFQRDPVSLSSITLFARDPRSGALTQLPGEDGCISEDLPSGECTAGVGIRGASSIVVSRDGRHVYVAAPSDAVAVFARDAETGALTQLPEPWGCVSQTGNGGRCTKGKALDGAYGLALSRDGRSVYVASEQSHAVAVFSRNRKTGVLTQLPDEDGCISENGSIELCRDGVGLGDPFSVAVSPDGRSVYVVSPATHELAVLARDRSTGALRHVQCLENDGGVTCEPAIALRQPYSVAVGPDSRRVYVAARDSYAVAVFAQDPATGSLTQLASPEGCVSEDGSEGLCTDGRALRIPRSVTVFRRQVYVAAQGSRAVAVLRRKR
jgi:DNA-binding beta-propeller fold protein YncE